jgi:hypothetical protein
MNKKAFIIILIILISLKPINASHLSNVTITPEAINTTGYINYSVVIYNTSGDAIKEIQLEALAVL